MTKKGGDDVTRKLLLRWKYRFAIGRMARLQKKFICTLDGDAVQLEQDIIKQWDLINMLQVQLGIRSYLSVERLT